MLRTLKHSNPYSYKARRRRNTKRAMAITVVSLLIISVGVGGAYTWYMGQRTAVAIADVPTAPQPSRQALPSVPKIPAKDAKVGIALQTLSTPVTPGQNIMMAIRTLPTAVCSISFTYGKDNIRSKDTGLAPKAADEYGSASWTWKLMPDVPVGVWPAEVTCAHNGQSAYLRGDITVQR